MQEKNRPATASASGHTAGLAVLKEATEVIGITHQRHCIECEQGCQHPYSYAAHASNSEEQTADTQLCFLSDSLFGLLGYLQRKNIALTDMQFISLTYPHPVPVNARLYGIIDGRWSG